MTFMINYTISDSFAENVHIIVRPCRMQNAFDCRRYLNHFELQLEKVRFKTTWSFWVKAFCQLQKLVEESFYLLNLFIAGGHILADF